MKDNGVSYTSNLSFSLYPTKPLTVTGSVPQTPLGVLVDEPVTFTPKVPDYNYNGDTSTDTACVQNKGVLIAHPTQTSGTYELISNQLIPNGTAFDFRFKWISYEGSANPSIGMVTGTSSLTWGVYFRYDAASGGLLVYNNNTLLATIATPVIGTECKIERDNSNNITAYYGGVALHTPVSSSSAMAILADSNSGTSVSGWLDMKLNYTEARRVLRLGNQGLLTGSYDPKFSALTHTGLAEDTKVYVGSGSPLQMTLDYTQSTIAVAGTGTVKVATGCGWLIFHDSEVANPVSGSTVVHYIP